MAACVLVALGIAAWALFPPADKSRASYARDESRVKLEDEFNAPLPAPQPASGGKATDLKRLAERDADGLARSDLALTPAKPGESKFGEAFGDAGVVVGDATGAARTNLPALAAADRSDAAFYFAKTTPASKDELARSKAVDALAVASRPAISSRLSADKQEVWAKTATLRGRGSRRIHA